MIEQPQDVIRAMDRLLYDAAQRGDDLDQVEFRMSRHTWDLAAMTPELAREMHYDRVPVAFYRGIPIQHGRDAPDEPTLVKRA